MPALRHRRTRLAVALGAPVAIALTALATAAAGGLTSTGTRAEVHHSPVATTTVAPAVQMTSVARAEAATTEPDSTAAPLPVGPLRLLARPPALTVSLTAALADAMDVEVNPGDVLRYVATIANGGADDALGVAFAGLLDANTTLVAGSLRVSPLAFDDTYSGAVAATAFPVAAATGLIANDAAGIPAGTVASFGGGSLAGTEATNAAGTTATFGAGGQLTVNANGSLSLTAPAGFSGTVTFRYRLANAIGADAAAVSVSVAVPPTAVADGPAAGSVPGDAYHTAFNTAFALAAPGVRSNDTLGGPVATVASFGGGSLGGAVTANAAGATATFGTGGSLSVASTGAVAFTPSTGFTGPFAFQYRLANTGGTSDATVTIAVGTRPAIVADTYPGNLTGNVPINTATSTGFSVLTNDAGSAPVLAITAQSNGVATLEQNGTFSFRPALGYAGPASFSYTVANGFGTTAAATVSLTFGTPTFFVVAGAAAGGDGRYDTPFNCLAGTGCLSASTADDPGDRIYVASGAYTGGLTLLNTQVVIGQGAAGASFAALAGTVWSPDAGPQPAINGTAPTITTTAAGTNGVTLGSGNTLRGLAFGNATGSAIAGTTFGTLGLAEVSVVTTGQALNLDTGALLGSFSRVASSGGTNNVRLRAVGGTAAFGIATDALSGATSDAVRIDTGTGSFTFPGTISNTTALAVNITGTTGGTLAFSGSINPTTAARGMTISGTSATTVEFSGAAKQISAAAAGGVTLTNNTGSSVRFTGGGLAVATTTGAAFTATGGGTVVVTGVGNTIATTTGRTLNVASTTVGTGGLVFQSIASAGGTSGIVLNATGATAGLSVTGTGTAGSGGTILTTSGDAVSLTSTAAPALRYMILGAAAAAVGETRSTANAVAGAGIAMNGVAGAVFRDLKIARTGSHGIVGTGVNGMTLSDTDILNAGDGAGENALEFGAGASNLTGTVALTNVRADGAATAGLRVANTSGTLSLTVTGGRFANTQNLPGDAALDNVGGDGIQLSAAGTAAITANVSGATFAALESDGIQGVTSGTSGATLNLTAATNTFTGYRAGAAIPAIPAGNRSSDNAVEFNATGTTTLRYTVSGNTMTASENQAILLSSNDASTVDGSILNNLINGSASGYGIEGTTVADETASVRLRVDGNTVSNTELEAMAFNSALTSTLNLTIANNTVTTRPRNLAATFENIQSRAIGQSTMCWNVRGNTVALGGTATGGNSGGIRLFRPSSNTTNPRLEQAGGGADPLTTLQNNNPAAATPLFATASIALVASGTCTLPAATPAALGAPVAEVRAPAEALATVGLPGLPEAVEPAFELPVAAPTLVADALAAPVEVRTDETEETAAVPAAQGVDRREAAASAAREALAGETVSVGIGILAAGKSVTVRYDATLANPFPRGFGATARATASATGVADVVATRFTGVVQSATVPRAFAGVAAPDVDAGWRLLAPPVGGLSVATLAGQNLVQGIPGYYPTFGANILTTYDGTTLLPPAGGADALVPGQGFFWYFYDRAIVPPGGPSQSVPLPFTLTATGPATSGPVTVPLRPASSNMLGNPFTQPLDVTNLGAWATGGTLASNVAQVYESNGYVPTTLTGNSVGVWAGMFVESGTATALVIPPTAQGTPPPFADPTPAKAGDALADTRLVAFELRGAAADTGLETLDRAAVLFFHPDATPEWDVWDAAKLTPPSAAFALLAFDGPRDGVPAQKAQESRPFDLTAAFDVPLSVQTQGTTGHYVLSWPRRDGIPTEWQLLLHDLDTDVRIDLATHATYAFDQAATRPAGARFALSVAPRATATGADAAPSAFALAGALPNPVRDAARIRFDVPDAAHVTVEVYDVLGRLAATVIDGTVAAGRHEVPWRAAGFPGGTYIVRMRAETTAGVAFAQSQRLTVVR